MKKDSTVLCFIPLHDRHPHAASGSQQGRVEVSSDGGQEHAEMPRGFSSDSPSRNGWAHIPGNKPSQPTKMQSRAEKMNRFSPSGKLTRILVLRRPGLVDHNEETNMNWQLRDNSARAGRKPAQQRDHTTIASMQITEQEKQARDEKSQKLRELRLSAPIAMPAPAKKKATKR